MNWTVLVKSPVISQWADFSVTAPSGLVPWPAFYDGTEVVTVSWGGAWLWTNVYANVSWLFTLSWTHQVLPLWYATLALWWKRYYMWTYATWVDQGTRSVNAITNIAVEDWWIITSYMCNRWWAVQLTWSWLVSPQFFIDWTNIHCQARTDFSNTAQTTRYMTFDTLTNTYVWASGISANLNNVWVNVYWNIPSVPSTNSAPAWTVIWNSIVDWWFTYSSSIIWYSYITWTWSYNTYTIWWIFVALRS